MDINKVTDLFLQFFSLDFLNKKLFPKMNIHSISKHLIFHFFVFENSTLLIEILFVKSDPREKNARITHDNILKHDVILISSFYGNHER
jgi:hypothetical protein